MAEEIVVIVGAGPSGLATSACLNLLNIPNLILERENCYASLWKNRAYDRLKLHLAKQFCHLPHMPYPPNTPTFIPRLEFIRYIDNYVSNFNIKPRYNRSVESATYDDLVEKWKLEVKNIVTGEVELYIAKFLVIATGENSKGFIPQIPGLESFGGGIVHSSQYKSGEYYDGKKVLVVGCGNSGMEIAYDLSNFGASTSIVIRSPFHVVTKEMIYLGMVLLKFLPLRFVDGLIVKLEKLTYGNLSKYGIHRPAEGPFYVKAKTGRSAVIDVGTIEKIKKGVIKVFPAISRIEKNNVAFDNGEMHQFDDIIFATGYESTANNWLKDYKSLLDKNGMPKNKFPEHWKGGYGLYCAGLSRRGLAGVSMDAKVIANDIDLILNATKKLH
ncbi:FAD-dependent pyridine nucleotide-disulfide oxidoreductase [Macleaya cordata]|uniref:Flavin-containing monooxygenase n=1 Tax=Macleaya cordata TaxID=56857 RepID=A0A200R0V2_MACCD|nr:FAD-dependent pyridine nucleotide-disulfide oxidoreductase [Macleaya cordata]